MAVVSAPARVMVSLPVPPVMRLHIGDRGGVGAGAEGQYVVAGAQVDSWRW